MTTEQNPLRILLFPLTPGASLNLHRRVVQDTRAWMLPHSFEFNGQDYMVAMVSRTATDEGVREATEDEILTIESQYAMAALEGLLQHINEGKELPLHRVNAVVAVMQTMLERMHAAARAKISQSPSGEAVH